MVARNEFRKKPFAQLAEHTVDTYFPTPGRPKLDRPASAMNDREYTEAETEFLVAMEQYKRTRKRPWPTCCEILAVLIACGYRKVAAAGELPKFE